MSRESFKVKVLAEAEADMLSWGERPLVIDLDITSALAICGALQLALRHPGFAARPSAKQVRAVVNSIEQQIPAEFTGLKKLITLGFHQRFDE